MIFAPIPAHDYPAIARAIAAERRAKRPADLRALPSEARREAEIALREDPHIWAAIVEWADHMATTPRPNRQPGGGIDEARHLAAVTLRTAAAALRKWFAEGRQPGEPEARAYKMLYLARRFARLTGDPHPGVDAAGAITFPEPQREAA